MELRRLVSFYVVDDMRVIALTRDDVRQRSQGGLDLSNRAGILGHEVLIK